MNDEEEIDPAEGIDIQASFILDWLTGWQKVLEEKRQTAVCITQQFTIEQVKMFLMEIVAEKQKQRYHEAFDLPNFKQDREEE